MSTALDESIDFLNKEASKEPGDCVSITETEEIGPTHELRVGEKLNSTGR